MTWIQTYSGKKFDLLNPTPEMVCIEDIAHHLSLINRFTGATTVPYSVAQHSIYVSMLCPPEFALEGLLHDAHEAYIGDISSPMSGAMIKGGFIRLGCEIPHKIIEHRADVAIADKFQIERGRMYCSEVVLADHAMLVLEAKLLFKHRPIEHWTNRYRGAFEGLDKEKVKWISMMLKRHAKFEFPWQQEKEKFLDHFQKLWTNRIITQAAREEMQRLNSDLQS